MNNGVERNQCSVERSRVESRSKTNYNSESSKIVNEIIIEEFHPLLLFFFLSSSVRVLFDSDCTMDRGYILRGERMGHERLFDGG